MHLCFQAEPAQFISLHYICSRTVTYGHIVSNEKYEDYSLMQGVPVPYAIILISGPIQEALKFPFSRV